MPNWVAPLLVFCGVVGFIGFAFRQGMKVTPDKDNPHTGSGPYPGSDGSGSDGSHHSGGFF